MVYESSCGVSGSSSGEQCEHCVLRAGVGGVLADEEMVSAAYEAYVIETGGVYCCGGNHVACKEDRVF